MLRIAVISAILEDPHSSQKEFNQVVSEYVDIVRGRMGIPFEDGDIGIVSIVVVGTLNQINSFTGRIGNIKNVIVKTAISKKEVGGN